MANPKFKIGDKVKLIENYEVFRTGDTGVVTGTKTTFINTDEGLICVEFSKGGTAIVFGCRLKLIESSKSNKLLTLPTDSEARKDVPVFSGCMKYFPAALAGVSKISKAGNDKHNPGQELHHDRSKSLDHKDCILRHLMDTEDLLAALERGQIESTEQILAEVNALAWRALAYSQSLHEKYAEAPLAPGAKLKKGNENE